MKSRILTVLVSGLCTLASVAQDEPKLSLAPTGRVLMDGAIYGSNDNRFTDGVAIPDVRLGLKAGYGMWKAKIDIGFAYGKIGLKDIYLQADLNPSTFIRVGNFIHQFGLQSATSSSMKEGMEEPTSNEVFNYSRQLGVMAELSREKYLGTFSVHAEGQDALLNRSNVVGKERFGFMTRQVWRPSTDPSAVIAQVGISAAYDKPDKTNIYTLNGNFPTRVAQVSAIGASVSDVRCMWRFTPELLLAHGPIALESQYFYYHAVRRGSQPGYTGSGAYALVRGLVMGGDYAYSPLDGGLATPRPKSLEIVGSYNYSNLTDAGASIFGGRLNDVAVCVNYYINKYMMCRLRYSYTYAWNRMDEEGKMIDPIHLNTVEARIQILF